MYVVLWTAPNRSTTTQANSSRAEQTVPEGHADGPEVLVAHDAIVCSDDDDECAFVEPQEDALARLREAKAKLKNQQSEPSHREAFTAAHPDITLPTNDEIHKQDDARIHACTKYNNRT